MFSNGTISVNLLQIYKGGYCSEHQHGQKMNMFHVIDGKLEVSQWPGTSEGERPDVTILEAGQSTIIPVGVWHKFRALENTTCLEVYSIRFTGLDICRRTQGGREK